MQKVFPFVAVAYKAQSDRSEMQGGKRGVCAKKRYQSGHQNIASLLYCHRKIAKRLRAVLF